MKCNVAAALVVAALPYNALAQANELTDKIFTIKVSWLVERESNSPASSPDRSQRDDAVFVFEAVGGKLVLPGFGDGCFDGELSLVYQPGARRGTAQCPQKRVGTELCWSESSAQASYETRMSAAGNVFTVSGRMTGTSTRANGDRRRGGLLASVSVARHLVSQTLRLRVRGDTCEVLEFRSELRSETSTDRTIDDETRREQSSVREKVWTNPGATCEVTRRSGIRPSTDEGGSVRRCQ
ncbi:MAG: hypothetical protein U1F37_09410 [Alphaproteobacteria bacterium]